MTDWLFRISSQTEFQTDLNAFCTQYGYPQIDTSAFVAFSPHLRFDFDYHQVKINIGSVSAPNIVDRGLHVNVRGTALPKVSNADLALTKLDADLKTYFSALTTITNTATAPLTGGQVWHTTGTTILIDPAPVMQKRVWC